MLDFIIIAAPRSGTTWLANYFTNDGVLCLHDPLMEHTLEALESYEAEGKHFGISCTAIMCLPDWLQASKAQKLIVHRPHSEILDSLQEVGLPDIPDVEAKLNSIEGLHVNFMDLWDEETFASLHLHLTGMPLDRIRYRLLKTFHIQPQFERLHVNPLAVRDFVRRVQETL